MPKPLTQITVSSDYVINKNDETIIVVTDAGIVNLTLPLLAMAIAGHVIEIIVRGPNRAVLLADASDGDALEEVVPSHVLAPNAHVKVTKLVEGGPSPSIYWKVITREYGITADGHYRLGPAIIVNEKRTNKGRLTVGDALASGFTQEGGNLRGLSLPGVNDSTRGLHIGDNGDDPNFGKNDFRFRAYTLNDGDGTLELLYNNRQNLIGALVLRGNGGARLNHHLPDGALVITDSAPEPYRPGPEIKIEYRLGEDRKFALTGEGHIQTDQVAVASGPLTNTDAANALKIYDTNDNLIGFIPIYPTLW